MPYATLADMEARYGIEEIIARTNRTDGAGVDTVVLDRALQDADAEIDAYLSTRYALPLPAVPKILVRIACDIARYHLWQEMASDEVRRRYEDAIRLLGNIAKGLISLGIDANQPKPVLSSAAAQTGSPPVFSRDATGGY
ncbi:MAG: DUF1320 family protein [Deltaproteobacteria bacterium]|nr:DUF1320 family protein [Deltaproteobacteria bacterium]